MYPLKNIFFLGSIFVLLTCISESQSENVTNHAINYNTLYKSGANINKIIDDNLKDIQIVLSSLDPMNLADVPLNGKGSLKKGLLKNVSLVKRTGHCTLSYLERILSIDIDIGWENLICKYLYNYKLWFIQRNGKLNGKIDSVKISFTLDTDFDNYKIILQKLKFYEVGNIDINLGGSFGNKVESFIIRMILKLAKRWVVGIVEEMSSNVLQKIIDDFNKSIPNHEQQFEFINNFDYNLAVNDLKVLTFRVNNEELKI